MLLWEAFLKRAELAGAAGGEIAFDLGFPFRLVALGDPGRQRGLLVFRQLFDRVLDLSRSIRLSYPEPRGLFSSGASTALNSAIPVRLHTLLPRSKARIPRPLLNPMKERSQPPRAAFIPAEDYRAARGVGSHLCLVYP